MARRALLLGDSEKKVMRTEAKVDVNSRFARRETYASTSGSEHDELYLRELVDSFIENGSRCSSCRSSPCECEDSWSSLGGELFEILSGLAPCADAAERVLLAAVEHEVGTKRQVMARMRMQGYNAAICKSRWEGSPGGAYEFIDVVLDDASERILIDTDFQQQFEIARPSPQYAAVARALPTVFVGRAERLMAILNVMAEAAKQSLKQSGLIVPPWRKRDFMRKKWLSSYKRTTTHDYEETGQVDAAVEAKKQNVAKVNNNEWTPPALKSRVISQRCGPAGLACILRESGLTSSFRSFIPVQCRSLPVAI